MIFNNGKMKSVYMHNINSLFFFSSFHMQHCSVKPTSVQNKIRLLRKFDVIQTCSASDVSLHQTGFKTAPAPESFSLGRWRRPVGRYNRCRLTHTQTSDCPTLGKEKRTNTHTGDVCVGLRDFFSI